MRLTKFLGGASAMAIALSLWSTDLLAQTSLPAIDIGKPKQVMHTAVKPNPGPRTGASRVAQGGRGNGAPVPGAGTGGAGQGGGGGTGAGGYGGAGAGQDPYNKSYVLQNTSTGTKTNTPVMDTPVNVQSVSQEVLKDQQVTTLSQALQNVSGVIVTDGAFGNNGTGSSGILVRGFQTSTYYRDGFRVDASYSYGNENISTRQLANVSSVEVLKGPGAILYGLSDPGGIINIVTKEPLDAPYYAAEQQVGSLALYRTTVDATGPLNTDKSLLYRVNMSYENNGAPFGSFIDFTHSQSLFVAPVVKWNVDAATWVKLEGEYTQIRSDWYFPLDPLFNGAFVPLPRNFNYGASSPYNQSVLFGALTWSHQFDKDWSIKQQIAYYYNYGYTNEFFAATPAFIGNIPAVQDFGGPNGFASNIYSTDVDITGHINTFGAEHTLLLGGDVFWSTVAGSGGFNGSSTYNFLFNPINLGVPFPLCGSGGCNPNNTYDWQSSAGLYLQDQVKLPYDFFLLAGARYQYVSQASGTGPAQYYLTPTPALAAQALTPRFGLLWRPQEWLSLYGNYTEGFGPNSGYVWPGELAPPTSASSWEAGAKIELFGGKLRATADYFELVKTNVPFPDPNPAHICAGGGPGSCELIAGAARSTGPELDIQGEILPGWSVTAAYTNDDVRVTKAQPGANPGVGQRLQGVPRNVASLFTTYEFQNDSVLKGLKVGAGYHYMGSRPVIDTINPPWAWPLVPSYGTVDLMAAYSFVYAGSKMTAQVNVTNLFDRTYYPTESNYPLLVPGPGAGLSYRSYGAPFAVVGSLRAELDKGATPPPWLLPTATVAPSLPSFTWTGLYAGAQMGFGWGDNDGTVDYATAQGQLGHSNLTSAAQGVIGGAHIGYNQQFDQWVLGLEGSVDGATVTKNFFVPAGNVVADLELQNPYAGVGGTATGNIQSGVQGSIRARAGYAFGRLLPYVTGGVAFGAFKSDAQVYGLDLNSAAFGASGFGSATRVGWTLGAGVEYAVNNHWSLLTEYRYSDFGHLPISTDPSAVGVVFALDRHLDQQQVQVGFSYKLFAGPEPEAPPVPLIVKGPALADNASAPPAVPPPSLPFAMNWTGFYVGAHIGYGDGLNDGSITYATPGGLAGQSNLSSSTIVVGGSSNRNGDAIGVIGGFHLGYNRQFDKWVVGLEGSVDPTLMRRWPVISIPDTAADPTGGLGIGVSATGAIWSQMQGSVRARAGYALDRMLFYGTGGVAIGAFGSTFQLWGIDLNTLAPFYAADQHLVTRVGWTVGAGVEYAVNPHWSVRGEYRYSDFGHMGDSPAPTSMGVFYAADRHLDQQQVQVGVSYNFNGAAAPVETKTIVADLPSIKGPPPILVSPPPVWTGFYAGANLGGGWTINNSDSWNYLPFTDPSFPVGASEPLNVGGFLPNLIYLPGDNGYTNLTAGVVGGGQLGYNVQIGQAIIGAEADIQATTIASGHNGAYLNVLASPFLGGSVLAPLAGGAPVGNVGAPWFGTVRGRAGWLLNPTLALYGTGGFAYGALEVAGYSTMASGWTAGAGGEWMFAPNWSAKLEYLYINATAGSSSNGGLGAYSGVVSSKLSPAINVVRTGLNYHFNWAEPVPVVAKY